MKFAERPRDTILKILSSKDNQVLTTKDEILYLLSLAMNEISRLETVIIDKDNDTKDIHEELQCLKKESLLLAAPLESGREERALG